jgi:DNA-binding NtrC family response regulator
MLDSVLFVDDDADLRDVMRETLTRLGVSTVVTAGSLQDVEGDRDAALACELAFLDLNLGEGEPNGINVYEWLEHEHFAGHVVFLTGHGNNDPRVRTVAGLGGSQVASKPITIAKLKTLIGDAGPGS